MSISTELSVIASGAVSSIGLSAASTCAAIRASLNNFRETHFVDSKGEPVLGAMVPTAVLTGTEDDEVIQGGPDKLAAMFVRAVRECSEAAGGIDPAQTALLLVGPEGSRPGVDEALLRHVFDTCQATAGMAFHAASRITQVGTPGLAVMLKYSRELLAAPQESGVQAVLIAGLDSLLNGNDIRQALQEGRILTSANADGFIPGEACACILVVRSDAALARRRADGREDEPAAAILRLRGIGLAQESATLSSRQPSRGRGLATAIAQALGEAELQAHDVHNRMSDATAESYFFEEASYAWTRLLRQRSPEGYLFTTPMNRVGHIGAAMGPLTLVLALDQVRKQWAAGENILIHLSSNSSPRAALVLTAA
ncbi:hypothetical protein FNU76_14780 [Chitinimonas arctica]|uniref:3-oxoacyl-ACP synthase n=1 Tax=Chitinimonas arctica TaxID=2594795 RepID=A0A516SH89_9NEIS|nr:hypothetical protein [Chitinimonas arctica]QDQ27519.1 hypothetical protein FNU76_14780 [Chitinimonas arctica]